MINRQTLTRCFALALLACLPLKAWAQSASPLNSTASAATNPAVEKFYSSLLFHSGFNGDAIASLTPAEPKPQSADWAKWLAAHPEVFQSGVVGQSIQSGDYALTYDLGSDHTIGQTGAAAIWLSATQWKRAESDSGYFFALRLHASNRQLMIARMGNPLNKECLYAHIQADKAATSVTAGSTRDWKDRDWHLLVMSWGPNWLEFSLDGAQPSRASLSQNIPVTGPSQARIFISAPRIVDTFLIDEVMVFSRPLEADEVKWLFSNRNSNPQVTTP